jgi:hypothetical protein
MSIAHIPDAQLLKFVVVYMKIGVIFSVAILLIYLLTDRSGLRDSNRVARLRALLNADFLNVFQCFVIIWVVVCISATWPQILYRAICKPDTTLD